MCVISRGPTNRSLTESTALNGFAHIEFASTEDVLRAVRQGAPHGFRYRQRLLDIDFALVYSISGLGAVWSTSQGGPRWMADLGCCSGHMTSPQYRRGNRLYVSLPFPPHRLTLRHMLNNSAAIPRTKVFRSSHCVFAT